MVVNGSKQKEGREFYEMFAAVLWFKSLCILVTVFVILGYHIWQIDFASVYLNADLDKELYVWPASQGISRLRHRKSDGDKEIHLQDDTRR